jgi:hypothetical protein
MNAFADAMGSYYWLFGRNRGVSVDALELEATIKELSSDEPQSTFLDKQGLFQELFEVYRECSVKNWDGYGAKAVDSILFGEAFRFLEILPSTISKPEISTDPDGEIAFEWYGKNKRVFSVSVGQNGELTYAGIFGSGKTKGTELLRDEIPEIILENINRVFL